MKKSRVMKWIDWNIQKPTESGYYLFAVWSGGNSYGNSTDFEVNFFSEKSDGYGLREYPIPDEQGSFRKIIAWMTLPKFPIDILKKASDG